MAAYVSRNAPRGPTRVYYFFPCTQHTSRVPRIELLSCIFAGLSGGLVGVLWSGAVLMPWLARLSGAQALAPRPESALNTLAGAATLAAGGAALGFLFWLGWALISLVNAPWYVPGLLFGLLTWAGIAAPLLIGAALRLRGSAGSRWSSQSSGW